MSRLLAAWSRMFLFVAASAIGPAAASTKPPSPAAAAAGDCDSTGRFECGLVNAEDLVRLPGTPWVIASSLNFEFSPQMRGNFGPLMAVRIDTRAVQQLYPTPGSGAVLDAATFPDCARPPEPISSHGLNVTALGKGSFRLLVANHGGRQSIEIIDLTLRGNRFAAKWRGCILAPTGIFPNAVVALPDGGIALSGNGVAIWKPKVGWRKLDGMADSNGIELSRDGRSLFVALHKADTVVRVPIVGGAIEQVAKLDFHADNLRWGDDGGLYVAGAVWPNGFAVGPCLSRPICEVAFAAARINPASGASREIFRSDALAGHFGMATAVLQIGNDLWFGTAKGDRVLVVPRVK